MEPLTLTCKRLEAGWAYLELSCGGSKTDLVGGYCTDLFNDLCQAGLDVLEGATNRVAVSLDDEPREYRIVLTEAPADSGAVELRVLTFPSIHTETSDDSGVELFFCGIRRSAFAGAVVDLLRGLHARYGDEGFAERWMGGLFGEGGFPHERLGRLVARLDSSDLTA